MLVVLSPSKSQDVTSERHLKTQAPLFTDAIATLVKKLHGLSASELGKLMHLSPKLAELNFKRYQDFDPRHFTNQNSKAAILAYQGDVYQGLDAATLSDEDLYFANQHLLILSGLYGALRPLDLIQAYRLEMGTPLASSHYKNLYVFWHTQLNAYINERLAKEKVLINLASEEYSKAMAIKALTHPCIKIEFKDLLKGKYQIVGIKAKKARGTMARFIIKHRLIDPKDLEKFNEDGYHFMPELSNPEQLIFHRG